MTVSTYRERQARCGEVAYNAYAEATGGKTHDGRQMPKWSELPDRIRNAWEAAAKAAVAEWQEQLHEGGRG